MRTAIFIGLTYLGDSIRHLSANEIPPTPDNVIKFYAFILFAFIVMDIIEFFGKSK